MQIESPPADLHLSFIIPRWRNFHRECSWQPNLQHPTLISFLKIHSLSLRGEEKCNPAISRMLPKGWSRPRAIHHRPCIQVFPFSPHRTVLVYLVDIVTRTRCVSTSASFPSLWEGRGNCALETPFRTENSVKLLEGFQEGDLACTGSSVVFNCPMDRLIGWCLFSTIFLLALHILWYFFIFSQGATIFKITIKTFSFGGQGRATGKYEPCCSEGKF